MKEYKVARKYYRCERDYNFIYRTSVLVFVLFAVHIVKVRLWILSSRVFCDNGLVYVEIVMLVMPYE
jgi:hypothetical protein